MAGPGKASSMPPAEAHAGGTISSHAAQLLLATFLGLACGYLVFNWSYIVHISHSHIHLHQHHKATAFCAFIGCRLTEDMEEFPGSGVKAAGGSSTAAAAVGSGTATPVTGSALQAASPSGSKSGLVGQHTKQANVEVQERLDETRRILSARVCGSPAVDGYAHVVPSCLEMSPTNKWWEAYYRAGGKQSALVAHIEQAADYDGLAVKWGLTNKVADVQACAAQCLAHLPGQIPGPFTKLPCNAFAFCPDEVCFEPDAHKHSKGDCWLKFTEGPASPEVNMRGDLPPEYRQRHPNAPARVQWISGVLLPPGVQPSNGTWSPRWRW